MKRFTRIICMLVALAMLIAVPVYASDASTKASSYFSSYRAYCYIASSTKLEVNFSVIGAGIMDELGASQIKVQRSSDGTNWTTIKTFESEDYDSMIDTDTGFHGATLSCSIVSGYSYRAYVTFYAKNSAGYGKRYYYTAIV